MILETYPQRIVKPLIELEKTSDLAAEHKLLLDLGETLLTHITGIIFIKLNETIGQITI